MLSAMRTARSGGSLCCSFKIWRNSRPSAHSITIYLHHAGMIQLFANFRLALKAFIENRIALHFRVRNLDGNQAARAQVGSAKDGGHAAAGCNAFNAVMVKLVAWMERSHCPVGVKRRETGGVAESAKLIRAPAVHTHAFDASNADELNTDIIAAIPLVGKFQKPLGGANQGIHLADSAGHFLGCNRSMQPVRAKQ